jgi:hypothetical protein
MKSSLPASASFRLTIAGLDFRVACPDRELLAELAERYAGFTNPLNPSQDHPEEFPQEPADLFVSIDIISRSGGLNDLSGNISFYDGLVHFGGQDVDGFIDGEHRRAELCFSSQYSFEISDYFLRAVLAVTAFRSGGLMLHAAGIVHQGMAYLFFGHSGSGKTTVARLSAGDVVLNDDLVVLMPDDGIWQVYGTPFWNPSQIKPAPGHARLAGFYRLVQDRQVYSRPMPTSQATAELIANIPVLSADPGCSLDLLVRAQTFAQNYPVYQLHFLRDASFWSLIEMDAFQSGKDH